MGRARPGSGQCSRQASLERRRRVCAAAVVAHTRTWHISHYITFFEIARDRVTHACMDNGPNVFLYSFYDMPVMYNAKNRAPRLSPRVRHFAFVHFDFRD